MLPTAVPKGAASGDNISRESQLGSPHTNYFPEANGKGRQREKQVLAVCCRSSKKKWTKLKELQLFAFNPVLVHTDLLPMADGAGFGDLVRNTGSEIEILCPPGCYILQKVSL